MNQVSLAYLGVIVIWSTTPLAIQWSGDGGGWLFAVAARMAIGALLAPLLLLARGQKVPLHARAIKTYALSGLSIYLTMATVYWSAQYLPSGWVAVLFGLSPIITGSLATWVLHERLLTIRRLSGIIISLSGLLLIFELDLQGYKQLGLGISGILIAVCIQASSAVWIKQVQADISGLATTSGGLLICAPLFAAHWWLLDGVWPSTLPSRSLAAIIYLGIMGSVVGFALYYTVLREMAATQVALITLITPVGGLLIGHWFNAEPVTPMLALGCVLIVSGLATWLWSDEYVSADAKDRHVSR